MLSTDVNKYYKAIEEIKQSNIYGCLAGSCLLPAENRENWEEEPDIDIFAYNEAAWIQAIAILQYKYGYAVGQAKSNEQDKLQNQWKIDKTIKSGVNKKNGIKLSTVKLNKNNITVNVSIKKYASSAIDVILTFDQTLIMRAWDIQTGNSYNLSKDPDTNEPTDTVSYPNMYREYDYSIFDTPWYLRQFDRVIKYWNRGYNTLPVAKFYLHMVTKTIEESNLWDSENYVKYREEFLKEWAPVKDKIKNWIKEKEAE